MKGDSPQFPQYSTHPQGDSHKSKDITLRSQDRTLLLANSLSNGDIGGPAARQVTALDVQQVARTLTCVCQRQLSSKDTDIPLQICAF